MPMLAGSATRPGLLALSRQRQAVAGLQQRCAGRTRLGSQHVARSTARPFAQQSQRFLSQSRQCAHAQLSKPRATEDKKQLFTSTKEEPASSEPPPPPPPPPKRRVGILGWLKRGVLFIAVGSTSALAYGIWHGRNPAEQLPPDPTKKTLVILGTGWGTVSLLKSLNTENYNVIVISPRNYFLFTPLLPSCTTGLIEHRSIMEPIRAVLRHKKGAVTYYEAKATRIDPVNRIVHMEADSEVSTANRPRQVPYDVLVVGVGATTSTFGIPGVQEHSCFLKEVADAQNIRKRIMDLIETSMYRGQSEEDLRRLLHMVVVGGGPTGVEFAGELQDFFNDDLRKWIPDIQGQFHVTLVEALPNVLPMFSRQLIEYTESTFKEEEITIRAKTKVKAVDDKYITVQIGEGEGDDAVIEKIPYGLLVWATGNAPRPVVTDLMEQIPGQEVDPRGLNVDEYLAVKGVEDIFAVGDCAISNYAPTAQVATQEGYFLARVLNSRALADDMKATLALLSEKQSEATDMDTRNKILNEIGSLQRKMRRVSQLGPFQYSHQGSLAYIGKERAVADLTWLSGNIASGGTLTYLFWRSAYLSMCFSTRNRVLVACDWLKAMFFGRDVSRE